MVVPVHHCMEFAGGVSSGPGVILVAMVSLLFLSLTFAASTPDVGVGAQYDSAHVYVAPADFDRFVASTGDFWRYRFEAGRVYGDADASSTMSQIVLTPAGIFSVFGFKTPVPYPFGGERTGYLVSDLDEAVCAARGGSGRTGDSVSAIPLGGTRVIQWPQSGLNMQLYWHTTAPSYAPLETIPRIGFMFRKKGRGGSRAVFWLFLAAKVSDDANAPGVERSASAIATGGSEWNRYWQDGRVGDGRPSSVSLRSRDDRMRSRIWVVRSRKPRRRGPRFWWGRIRLVTGALPWCSSRAGTLLKSTRV